MPRPKKASPVTTGLSDLGSLAMRQTATVVLPDPRFPGEHRDTGFRVEIESYYSDATRDVVAKARSALKIVGNDVQAADTSFSESVPEQVIAVTRRWWKEGESTDTITLNGVTMQATPDTVRMVYENPEFAWIQRAVQNAYLTLTGFFGVPKTA